MASKNFKVGELSTNARLMLRNTNGLLHFLDVLDIDFFDHQFLRAIGLAVLLGKISAFSRADGLNVTYKMYISFIPFSMPMPGLTI